MSSAMIKDELVDEFTSRLVNRGKSQQEMFEALKEFLFHDRINIHHCFLMLEKDEPSLRLSEDFMAHYITLPLMDNKKRDLTSFENWAYYFRYGGNEMTMDDSFAKTVTLYESSPV